MQIISPALLLEASSWEGRNPLDTVTATEFCMAWVSPQVQMDLKTDRTYKLFLFFLIVWKVTASNTERDNVCPPCTRKPRWRLIWIALENKSSRRILWTGNQILECCLLPVFGMAVIRKCLMLSSYQMIEQHLVPSELRNIEKVRNYMIKEREEGGPTTRNRVLHSHCLSLSHFILCDPKYLLKLRC